MLPVNWAWIDLVNNFKKNPSASENKYEDLLINSRTKKLFVCFPYHNINFFFAESLPVSYIFKHIIDITINPEAVNPQPVASFISACLYILSHHLRKGELSISAKAIPAAGTEKLVSKKQCLKNKNTVFYDLLPTFREISVPQMRDSNKKTPQLSLLQSSTVCSSFSLHVQGPCLPFQDHPRRVK